MDFMLDIDDSALSGVDRLGVAACRLNHWEWDDILGPKPEGFDDLPNYTPKRTLFRRRRPCKADYVIPAENVIESIIGSHNISRCWWKYVLGKSEEEWFRWYILTYISGWQKLNR